MLENIKTKKIILSSKSPRRQQLLRDMGIEFEVDVRNCPENYPKDLDPKKVPEYLAKLKSEPFKNNIDNNTIVITSDTIVILDNKILEKPKNKIDAIEMLKSLSNKSHTVISGVNIYSLQKEYSFSAESKVYFKKLSIDEIEFYINNYKPFDKAGSYGIQEWIGYIGIEKIEGSFYNVMGLPTKILYEALSTF